MRCFTLIAVLLSLGFAGCGASSKSNNAADENGTTPVLPAQTQPAEPETPSTVQTPVQVVPSQSAMSLPDAATTGDVETLKRLIAEGNDINEKAPGSGAPGLIGAITMNQTETALVLIEAGADMEATNREGSTSLHVAAFLCREEIVRALLAKGANRQAKNNAGATPLDSVAGPFEAALPIYDVLKALLSPYGFTIDYDRIKKTRPKIAEMLKAE